MAIFDKISSKTKEFTDSAKVSLKLSEEKRKLPELYERLGQFVYTRYAKGESTDEVYLRICAAIDAVNENIAALGEQLTSIRLNTERRCICPMCGAINKGAVENCEVCGSDLPKVEDEKDVTTVCEKCGNFVPFGAEFCPACGADMLEHESDKPDGD